MVGPLWPVAARERPLGRGAATIPDGCIFVPQVGFLASPLRPDVAGGSLVLTKAWADGPYASWCRGVGESHRRGTVRRLERQFSTLSKTSTRLPCRGPRSFDQTSWSCRCYRWSMHSWLGVAVWQRAAKSFLGTAPSSTFFFFSYLFLSAS